MTFRSLMLVGAAAFALAGCKDFTSASAVGNGEVVVSPSTLTIDYEKFTLDNGLEVVLQVDRSDPIVAVTTVIHAGSNREKPGRTGFAHFFEHMAFNDSENVPRGWNRKPFRIGVDSAMVGHGQTGRSITKLYPRMRLIRFYGSTVTVSVT